MEVLEKYTKENREKYLQPIWDTNEIYDETGVIIGEEGEMYFLFQAKCGTVVVRDIHLGETYQEGKDYLCTKKGIRRLPNGRLPFWRMDDYFSKTYTPPVILEVDPKKVEFIFEEVRYIFHSESLEYTDVVHLVLYHLHGEIHENENNSEAKNSVYDIEDGDEYSDRLGHRVYALDGEYLLFVVERRCNIKHRGNVFGAVEIQTELVDAVL